MEDALSTFFELEDAWCEVLGRRALGVGTI